MATYKFFLNVIVFSWEMSPLMRSRGSCALLGNLERPIFVLQSLVTIFELVLSLYETWLIGTPGNWIDRLDISEKYCYVDVPSWKCGPGQVVIGQLQQPAWRLWSGSLHVPQLPSSYEKYQGITLILYCCFSTSAFVEIA